VQTLIFASGVGKIVVGWLHLKQLIGKCKNQNTGLNLLHFQRIGLRRLSGVDGCFHPNRWTLRSSRRATPSGHDSEGATCSHCGHDQLFLFGHFSWRNGWGAVMDIQEALEKRREDVAKPELFERKFGIKPNNLTIGEALQKWCLEEQVGIDEDTFCESTNLTVRNQVNDAFLDLAIAIADAEGLEETTKTQVLELVQVEQKKRHQRYMVGGLKGMEKALTAFRGFSR
jgi:hypothetical protein